MNASQQSAYRPRVLTIDEQAWIKDRFRTAMRMALAVDEQQYVGSDTPTLDGALEGIAQGATAALARDLGLILAENLDFVWGAQWKGTRGSRF